MNPKQDRKDINIHPPDIYPTLKVIDGPLCKYLLKTSLDYLQIADAKKKEKEEEANSHLKRMSF